jgi:tRNA-Thr(GGU) m(6)t(6)A37 methyltransferase TsaA
MNKATWSLEGAPSAWLEIEPRFAAGLVDLAPGDELILLTWLHEGRRDLLQVHPRDDLSAPVKGVFTTRSADRPNPIGLHPVTLLAIDGLRLQVSPLEAIDGTPVLDLKPSI